MSSSISTRRAILQVLAAVPASSAVGLGLEALSNELSSRFGIELERLDLIEHLAWLRDHRFVDAEASALDPDNSEARRWFITPAGRQSLRHS